MAWLARAHNFKQHVGICNQPLAAQTVIKVTAAMAFTSSTKEIYTSQRLSVELKRMLSLLSLVQYSITQNSDNDVQWRS